MVDYLERPGRRDPLRHRRRRDASRRAADRRGGGAARAEDRRHRRAEDDRQRRLVRAENVWIRDGGHRGAARDLRGQRRGGSGAQRHRAREADGPRLGVHRGVFGAGQQPRELLPGSRGAVHAREVPVRAAAAARAPRPRGDRGRGRRRPGSDGDAARSGTRRGTSSTATSASFLRDAITDYFKRIGTAITLKYIDPSYAIRSVPATAHDSAFCLLLGQSAVHAGLSGRTNMVVSFWNHQFTHVPIAARRLRAQEDRPGGRTLEQRARLDRPAAGHVLIRAA